MISKVLSEPEICRHSTWFGEAFEMRLPNKERWHEPCPNIIDSSFFPFPFSFFQEFCLMISVSPGSWAIQSVTVNSQPASPQSGFDRLIVDGQELRIEPAGIALNISQSTMRSAVLVSRSQVFFADYSLRGDTLVIKMSRPQFAETVSIIATLDRDPCPN
jgi:hypothetical protein